MAETRFGDAWSPELKEEVRAVNEFRELPFGEQLRLIDQKAGEAIPYQDFHRWIGDRWLPFREALDAVLSEQSTTPYAALKYDRDYWRSRALKAEATVQRARSGGNEHG